MHGDVFFSSYVPSDNRVGCQVMPGSNYVYRVGLASAAPPPALKVNQQPGGIAGVTALYQPLYTKSKVVGLVSGGSIFNTDDGSFVEMGGLFTELNISLCGNPKGCKTFWMDLEG